VYFDKNQRVLFFIYDDGTVNKKIKINK